MTTAIATALDAFKPHIADDFVRFVTSIHARYVRQHGPKLRGISNSVDYRFYSALVCRCESTRGVLDDARLQEQARVYADAVTAEWIGKVTTKLGAVTDVVVSAMDTCGRFSITAKRDDQDVCLWQQRIIKSSTRGVLFHQFPARLYVDGKFTPEAQYKAQ